MLEAGRAEVQAKASQNRAIDNALHIAKKDTYSMHFCLVQTLKSSETKIGLHY